MNLTDLHVLAEWVSKRLPCMIFAIFVAAASWVIVPKLLFEKTPAQTFELLSAGSDAQYDRLKDHVTDLADDVEDYEQQSFDKQRSFWDRVKQSVSDPADQSLIIQRAARSHDTIRQSASILEILRMLLDTNEYNEDHKNHLWAMTGAYYQILLDTDRARRKAYRALSDVYDDLASFPQGDPSDEDDPKVQDAVKSELLRQLTYLAFRQELKSWEKWQDRAIALGEKYASAQGKEYRRKFLWIDQSQMALAIINDKDLPKAKALLERMRDRLGDEDLFLWSKLIQHRNDVDRDRREIVAELIKMIE